MSQEKIVQVFGSVELKEEKLGTQGVTWRADKMLWVFCVHFFPSLERESLFLCERKPNKKLILALVSIYDLSMDDRAIADLPTVSATMTNKRTKSVLRSKICGSAGSNVFCSLVLVGFGIVCWFHIALHEGSATLLQLLAGPLFSTSVPIEDLDRYPSLVIRLPYLQGTMTWTSYGRKHYVNNSRPKRS